MIHKKSIIGVSLLLSFIVIFLVIPSPFTPLEAADAKKKLLEIEKELKTKKEKVKESIKKEKSVMERIEDINSDIKKKEQDISNYDKRISQTLSETNKLSAEISDLNKKLSSRQQHLKERLRSLYKQQYGGHALILISANDYQDLIKKSKYISMIAHYDSKVINIFSNDIQEIISKKQKLETLNATLKTDRSHAEQMQKSLQTDRIKKDQLLSIIRSKRKAYEKTIRELEESSKQLRDMMEKLKQKELPKSITGKGFASSKGRFPWPVSGKVVMPYGEYKDPEFNIPVFKNGIEIKPDTVENPKAIAAGRVVYADWFKGYGLLLIIDHGSGYHSLYGNLSEIFLKTGDILISGTVVGKTGQSGLMNFPTVYFEIRHKGKPVDPMAWLKKNSSTGKKVRIK